MGNTTTHTNRNNSIQGFWEHSSKTLLISHHPLIQVQTA